MLAENVYDFLLLWMVLGLIAFVFLVIVIASLGGINEVKEFLRVDIANSFKFTTERLENTFLTYKLTYVIIIVFLFDFLCGWWYAREEMMSMTAAVIAETYIMAAPIKDGISAAWVVISNPFRLIGYILFVFLLRWKPDDVAKAAQKGHKIMK